MNLLRKPKLPNNPADRQVSDSSGRLTDPWWMYFSAVGQLLPDLLRGAKALLHPGAIPMVTATPGVFAESALVDNGTDITATDRALQFGITGGTQPGRAMLVLDGWANFTVNLSYDGVNWNLDNPAQGGMLLLLNSNGAYVYKATAGANPRALVLLSATLGPSGIVNAQSVFQVAGVQVVGAQQADPGTVATAPAVSLGNTSQVPDTVYSTNESVMLDELKFGLGLANTSIANLTIQIENLITDRNNLRTVLQAHGLMA